MHDLLLVEDHADSANVLARLLRSTGHHVQTAANCADARRLFAAGPTFDVLLLDVGLPDGDGCDLLRELATIRNVPPIAITGFGMGAALQRTKAAGFIAQITKPFDMLQLKDAVNAIKLNPPSTDAAQEPV